ncbi:MAG: hypothetical protein HOO86_08930 [Bacteroidales bacterium]|nr:hypothetical protein [Bacteroidales bacterium]
MQNKKESMVENEEDDGQINMENVDENVRYIKQLELQRIVLNKLIVSNLNDLTKEHKKHPNKKASNNILKRKMKK